VLAREIEEITSFEPSDRDLTLVVDDVTGIGPEDEIGKIVAASSPST
jgi:hypothetical protein